MSSRSQPFIARNTPPIFSFGRYTLDLIRGAFLRGADEIKLRPKSYETLKHLVLNAGRLVPKTELIEVLWPEAVSVSDDSVNHCVRDVRRALGDDGQEFIRTVPGRGYMFVVPVETGAVPAVPSEDDQEAEEIGPNRPDRFTGSAKTSKRMAAASVVAVLVLAGIGWAWKNNTTDSGREHRWPAFSSSRRKATIRKGMNWRCEFSIISPRSLR